MAVTYAKQVKVSRDCAM